MIRHQQNGRKKRGPGRLSAFKEGFSVAKTVKATDGKDMSIDVSLEKFSSDEFLPEKFREDETRLANSTLPHLPSSFK